MSYGAPFGVDRVPSNAGYGSYGGSAAFGGLRPVAPFQPAAAYNGGGAAAAPSSLPFGRIQYNTANNGFAPRATNSFLPSLPAVAGAQPSASANSNSSAFPAQPYPQPPSSSPAYSPPPFINQNADASSRQRALQAPSTRGAPFSATQAFNSASSAPAPPMAKFHRSRSSFIPNKWTRGPGDGTFGSIYLSFGGGDFAGRGGGGPNMAFDRPRPEELWEAEQERKRALAFAMNPQSVQDKATGTKKKKKAGGARKQNQSKAQLKALAQERAARKMLARARNHLLAHLSSSSCRLFSEADHVVAVSDDDLDELLRAGGGDAGKVVAHLKDFDAANEKFDDFAQLMRAIQEARKSAGDYGAGTEAEADAQPANDATSEQAQAEQPQEAKEESAADPAAADAASTPASPAAGAAPAGDATASPGPASGNVTARSTKSTASSKKAGGSTPRGPSIAEKRAAKKAEEDAAAAKAEQTKRAAAAKASAARAKKVQDEKAAAAAAAKADQPEEKQADSSATTATPAKAKPAATEATTTPAKPAESTATDAAAASPADETYGDDFD